MGNSLCPLAGLRVCATTRSTRFWLLAAVAVHSAIGHLPPAICQDTLDEAKRLSERVEQLHKEGKYADALPLAQRALEIRERLLGRNHEDVAAAINNLARLYDSMRDYGKAETLYRQALELWRGLLGEDHLDYAERLGDLAWLYFRMGKYPKAEPLLVRATEIRRKALGENDPGYAQGLSDLGGVYYAMGQYAKAEPLYIRALEIRKKALGEDDPTYAQSLNDLGMLHLAMGQYKQAEPLLVRAMEIRRKAFGEDHPTYAQSLNDLAGLYNEMAQYEKAEPLCTQASQFRKRVLGEGHPDYARSLNNLAGLCCAMGQYEKAERLYNQAAEILRKVHGEDHPDYATSLNNLAWFYNLMGQCDKAEPLYVKALEIREKALGTDHPAYALSLNNLAELYHDMGQYAKAEPLLQKAMRITRAVHGEGHPHYATRLINLASLYEDMDQYDRAKPLYLQAVEVDKKALGEDHPGYAADLNNLAAFYKRTGRYDEAEPLFRQASEIIKKAQGEDHPEYATKLNNLAALYEATGQYDKAEPLYNQALRIVRKAQGEDHPSCASILNNLSLLYVALARNREALEVSRQAAIIEEQQIERVFSVTSEKEKLSYLSKIAGNLNANLTLVRDAFSQDPDVVAWAMKLVLRRKGLVLESLLRQRKAVRGDQKTAHKFEEWNAVVQQLAAVTLRGPGKEGPELYRANLAGLVERKEKLETELSRLSRDFALEQKRQRADPRTIAKLLPDGSALIEMVRVDIRNFKAKGTEKRWLPAHYLAFVLRPGGQPITVDLGEADPIEKVAAEWREALTYSAAHITRVGEARAEQQLAAKAKALHRLVFAPFEKRLKGGKTLFLSPDGELNLIPFGALQDSEGKYLLERYCFNYLSSGRDLLKFGQDERPGTPPGPVGVGARPQASSGVQAAVLIANPDFDLSADARLAQASRSIPKAMLLTQAPMQPPANVLRSRDLRTGDFKPLPGTAQEARAIGALMVVKKPRLFLGGEALEETVKALHSPSLLHIATHGFFLPDQDLSFGSGPVSADARGQGFRGAWQRMAATGVENPLVRSGLALAGANQFDKEQPGKAEDGMLTAQEVSGLDLTGTDLVVLSACQTGLGTVRTGEGVFGLRRAFLNAGAKTLIMSLSKVPDAETKNLMIEFYTRWLSGKDKVTALHEASLAMLRKRRKEHGAAHPLYWGAFVAMGDPR